MQQSPQPLQPLQPMQQQQQQAALQQQQQRPASYGAKADDKQSPAQKPLQASSSPSQAHQVAQQPSQQQQQQHQVPYYAAYHQYPPLINGHPAMPYPVYYPDGMIPQAPKRKQVKNACTNCQKACKKCDDARPCPRCVKYNIADSCVNSVRKERKKGIKRGPYKRRVKSEGAEGKASPPGQRKNTNGMDDQYAMRAAAMPYGNGMMGGQYQYGQNGDYATSTAYGNAAAAYYPYPNQGAATNGKDQVMQQYNMSYPLAYHTNMLLPGANGEQTSQSPSQSQQQQASYASYPQGASLPPHYGSMVQQTSASTSTTSSPTATPVKIEKSHSMTPVPSTSSSSNTTSSPAASHPEEEGPSRLAQLASLSADALISQDRQAATPQQ